MTLISYFVISMLRHRVRSYSESYDTWLILIGSVQLTVQFDRKIRIWFRYRSHLNNDWFYLARFRYFAISMETQRLRTGMEVTWQMIISIWLSSDILSCRYKYTDWYPGRSRLSNDYFSLARLNYFITSIQTTQSSYRDQSHLTNESFYVTLVNYFVM